MSKVKGLIEKFTLAIYGEDPVDVVEVLAYFTIACLERWHVDLDDYILKLKRIQWVDSRKRPTLKA